MGRNVKVILQPVKFRKKNHVAVLCPNNPEVDAVIREFDDAEWSTGYRFWHIPLKADTLKAIAVKLKGIATVDAGAFKDYEFEPEPELPKKKKKFRPEKPSREILEKLELFRVDFIKKGYSEGTVKVYVSMLTVFFGYYKDKTDMEVSFRDVHLFLKEYVDKNDLSINYKRLMTNSLRRYFEYIGRLELSRV